MHQLSLRRMLYVPGLMLDWANMREQHLDSIGKFMSFNLISSLIIHINTIKIADDGLERFISPESESVNVMNFE